MSALSVTGPRAVFAGDGAGGCWHVASGGHGWGARASDCRGGVGWWLMADAATLSSTALLALSACGRCKTPGAREGARSDAILAGHGSFISEDTVAYSRVLVLHPFNSLSFLMGAGASLPCVLGTATGPPTPLAATVTG